jgi:hypothetical protein
MRCVFTNNETLSFAVGSFISCIVSLLMTAWGLNRTWVKMMFGVCPVAPSRPSFLPNGVEPRDHPQHLFLSGTCMDILEQNAYIADSRLRCLFNLGAVRLAKRQAQLHFRFQVSVNFRKVFRVT